MTAPDPRAGPDGARGRGPQKTTREDWIQTALHLLISEGVDAVKVLPIAERLDCARSSFYWYFRDRAELLDALLDHWQSTNARSAIRASQAPAATVNAALINVFACWADKSLFDPGLDLAIRDWARRSDMVRRALTISDGYILDALTQMFERYGFAREEAGMRARIVYCSQIGHAATGLQDSAAESFRHRPDDVRCLTGQPLTGEERRALDIAED